MKVLHQLKERRRQDLSYKRNQHITAREAARDKATL